MTKFGHLRLKWNEFQVQGPDGISKKKKKEDFHSLKKCSLKSVSIERRDQISRFKAKIESYIYDLLF